MAWCLQQEYWNDAQREQQKRLRAFAHEIIERFGKRAGKDLACIQEILPLATIPDGELYTFLISHAVEALGVDDDIPLNVGLIQGLAVMARYCPASSLKEDKISPDVWSRVLKFLMKCLKKIHRMSDPLQIKRLLQTISQLLDMMWQTSVRGINRENLQLHPSLPNYIKRA